MYLLGGGGAALVAAGTFLIYLAIYQLPENHSSIKTSALTADCCLGCTSMMQRDAPDDDNNK